MVICVPNWCRIGRKYQHAIWRGGQSFGNIGRGGEELRIRREDILLTFGKMRGIAILGAALALGLAVQTNGAEAGSQCGKASWYKMGHTTASGERMNPNALAGAHRTLPFGTKVRVQNLANGRSVVVRINDRGPFAHGRVIDVTQGAAKRLGMIRAGVARVKVTVVGGKGGLSGC